MPRPIARIKDKTGKTIAILLAKDPKEEPVDLPAIPQTEFENLLSRNMGNPARSMRLKAGISQKELASAMGISQPMVSKIERLGTVLSKPMAAKVGAAIKAILESRRKWKAKPPKTYDDLLEVQAPLLRLAASRKPRSPVERQLLNDAGDVTSRLETEKRTKPAGQRALPPWRNR